MSQWKERKTNWSQLDRSFDIEFWQEQEAGARFAAAWEFWSSSRGNSKAATPMNSDFKDLLKQFNAAGIEYLIIGGYAVIFHAEPRYTKDLIRSPGVECVVVGMSVVVAS